jgi:uncharacterized protein
MPSLSILIKPASSNCNLRCKYCFYHSVAEIRRVESYGLMSLNTLEIVVQKALQFADRVCTFAFQGGEPTLIGLDFYRKLIEFQNKYNLKKVSIHNAIQTNGMAMDDEWAKFLADNNFLVGISLDGPKDIHDAMRYDASGKGSFMRVMNTIALFNKHGVGYNILSTVNTFVARHTNKVYNFFKKNGFSYLQFIPCLDPLNEKPGNYDYSLTPERYAYFLKTLFDLWYEDVMKGNLISIRYFDNLVGMFMGYLPEVCGMMGTCSCQFVIEANGGVYPCDFYVFDEWYLGNIKDMGFEELKCSDAGKRFVEVSRHVAPECEGCKWLNLCSGGCRRSREPFVDGKPVLNYFCSAYREFFDYTAPRLQQLGHVFSRRQ